MAPLWLHRPRWSHAPSLLWRLGCVLWDQGVCRELQFPFLGTLWRSSMSCRVVEIDGSSLALMSRAMSGGWDDIRSFGTGLTTRCTVLPPGVLKGLQEKGSRWSITVQPSDGKEQSGEMTGGTRDRLASGEFVSGRVHAVQAVAFYGAPADFTFHAERFSQGWASRRRPFHEVISH